MSIIKNVIHKLEKISKKAIFGSIEAYRIYYRKKDWRNFALKNTKDSVLTEEQNEKVKAFFLPYTKVKTIFHEFYTEKMENFV